ncbi:MAG: metallophosphoesterase [Cellulosilyticaceae bacterium]
MIIEIPDLAVIALIGANVREKIAFAKKHFSEAEILNKEAFTECGNEQLEDARLTVIDVENLQDEICESIIKLSKQYHYAPIAIVFGEKDLENNLENNLQKKGFKKIYLLNSKEEIAYTKVQRVKLANNKTDVHGPFDIIGDIHGCYDELCELLQTLGYVVDQDKDIAYATKNRKVVFLGDLVDRGPKIPKVLKLVMSMVKKGDAYCVLGNHDGKLQRKLGGANVQIVHGLEKTLEQFEQESEHFIQEVKVFLDGLVSHYVFDEGKLVVAHAGLKEKLHGRESPKVRDLAMFGETTGETDSFGLPIRLNWSEAYRGDAFVVYGHTPQAKAIIINNTINIDTGCVFGGKLTAFRYPEKEVVEIKAKCTYCQSPRPIFRA